jgi:type IV pilus assembly protein PilB
MGKSRSDISKGHDREDAVTSDRSASTEEDTHRVSLDEVYGAPTLPASDSSEQTTNGDVMGELTTEPDSTLETSATSSEETPVSGIVRDEIVTALIQSGVVTASQVSDAMQRRKEDQELWRALETHPDLEMSTIRAAVAAQRGITAQLQLDTPPTRVFLNQVLEAVSPVDLARFLGVGLLPVHLDVDMDLEWVEHSMTVLSSDPLDRRVQSVLLSSPVSVTCRYAPEEVIADALAQVVAWMRDDGYEIQAAFPTKGGGPTTQERGPSDPILPPPPAPPTEHSGAPPMSTAPPVSGSSFYSDSFFRGGSSFGSSLGSSFDSSTFGESGSVGGGSGSRVFGSSMAMDSNLSEWVTASGGQAVDRNKVKLDRVVKYLRSEEIITDAQVNKAIDIAAQQGAETTLWRVVADLPSVDREYVYETAARIYAFKKEIVGPGKPDIDFIRQIMEGMSRKHRDGLLDKLLVPFEYEEEGDASTQRIVFVTPDPTLAELSRFVQELNLGRFELRYASEYQIVRLLEDLFPRKNEYLERISTEMNAFDLGTYEEEEDAVDEEALEAEISRSKLINLFEAALMEATRLGVSDIHIYPNPNRQVEIHFRLDGRLKLWHTEAKVHPEAFLAVVKDNSTNVDRFERDAAQDGFIQRRIDGALIRFRVSILPIATANQEVRAESIVIRILDDRKVLTDIRKLGMLDVALNNFNKAIRQPHGMVILTGPTGSGKSTTLVAALHQVITPEVNVLTVEDPVEYVIKGVRQIKLSHKLHLEGALRAILRHDPDIVMVGEMRDKDTAELAIKLANTGHLTFSTLHTNSAPAAVARLYKMGVEPFLIAYAINLIVAQRLIRVLCPECKEVDPNPDRVLMHGLGWTDEEIDANTIYTATIGSDCRKCRGLGYKGRRAVCETMYFTPVIRAMIAESSDAIDEDALREEALKNGMLTLAGSARILVNEGETSVDEMMRMTSMD